MARKLNKTSTTARSKAQARKTTTARPAAKRSPSANGNHKTAAGSPKSGHKEQLEKDRAQVLIELEALRAELQEAPELTGDEVDLNVYEREKTLGLVATYERRLEELDAALRAAEKGQYGICERCGNAIPAERLKIFPETRLCVNCKNEVEREARRLRM